MTRDPAASRRIMRPSLRAHRCAIALALTLAAGSAHAREWDTRDSAGGGISALMGGVVGVLGGAFVGGILGAIGIAVTRRPPPPPPRPGEPPVRTIDHSAMAPLAGMMLGGVVGGVLGVPTGAWLYGDSREFGGSWLASVGGGVGGAVVGGGLGYLVGALTDDHTWTALGAVAGLLAGSVVGYALTADDTETGARVIPLTLGGTF